MNSFMYSIGTHVNTFPTNSTAASSPPETQALYMMAMIALMALPMLVIVLLVFASPGGME